MDAYLYVYRNGKVFEHSGQVYEVGDECGQCPRYPSLCHRMAHAQRCFIVSSGEKRHYTISCDEGELETSKKQCVWFRDRNYEQAVKLFVKWKRQIYQQKRDELNSIEKELQKLEKRDDSDPGRLIF